VPKVTENAVITAPAEKVFQMFIEPERAVMFVPGLSRISNVSPDKRSWDFEFNWLGLVISGRSECTASEAPKKYQFKTLAGDKSSWTCRYEPDGGNTELSLKVEYEEPQLRHCSSPNYRSGLATDELVRYNFAVPPPHNGELFIRMLRLT
jgi:uncharacterized membrane protein